MKKNKNIFINLFIITTLTMAFVGGTCKKKSTEVFFEGRIIDAVTKAPLANANVSLASTSVQSWVYNSNFQDIANTKTSQDGAFSMAFNMLPATAYRLYIYKNNYFEEFIFINASDISQGVTYKDIYELNSEAEITINLKNSLPFDMDDRIVFRFLTGAYECASCCSSQYMYGYGSQFDTTITCKTHGNKQFIVESMITKDNNSIQRLDTVLIQAFQQNQLSVLY